ncbi:alpha/beta fold hydrolase [Mycolicibacterium thermoresistibile]
MLPVSVARWRDEGRWVRAGVGSVFVRSAPGTGPPVVLLHGYPSSSYDYRAVLPQLAGHPWLTMDFLGFGLSDKPRPHRYSLFEQADLVQTVVRAATDEPVLMIAHDMGTSVATELMARDCRGQLPFRLDRVVLTNGSVLLERASLRPIQRVLRGRLGPLVSPLINERMFIRGLGKVFSRQRPMTAEEGAAQWALLAHHDGHRLMHLLTSYLNERTRYADRWHGAVADWPKPLGFLWGTDDPVATTEVLAGLRELRPDAAVIELPGVGHYPQIETPEAFARAALTLLAA